MSTRIITWFLGLDGPLDNPTSTKPEVYLRNVVTFFSTSIRNNPGALHLFLTNLERLPTVNGFDIQEFIESLGVEVVVLPHKYVPPADYMSVWKSQFYLMAIIEFLGETSEPDDAIFVLDSDCVWVTNSDKMADELLRVGLLAYDTGFAEEEDINGLSRKEIGSICASLDQSRQYNVPRSAGGEFMGVTGRTACKLAKDLPVLWEQLIGAHTEGKKKFLTEEHWLSYLYLKNGYSIGGANRFVRRIWTALPPKPRNAEPSDMELTIWHLPWEKRYGLSRLYNIVVNPNSDFWSVPTGPRFVEYCGGYLGVPKRTLEKVFRDVIAALRWKLWEQHKDG